MKNLILGYPRGRHRFQCLETALDSCDIVTENFDKIKGPYDRIFTISESLLPIQAKLEKQWGLKNVFQNYKILKIHNPWLRENKLNNKSGKLYALSLPENGHYGE